PADLEALRRPNGVRLSSASLRPSPLWGHRGAFPTTVIFERANESDSGFGAPGPGERGRRAASPQQASAPRPGGPGGCPRRAPAPAGLWWGGPGSWPGPRRRRGSSPQSWRLEAGSCVRGRARSRGSERELCGGGGRCWRRLSWRSPWPVLGDEPFQPLPGPRRVPERPSLAHRRSPAPEVQTEHWAPGGSPAQRQPRLEARDPETQPQPPGPNETAQATHAQGSTRH
ncbi:putative insulin-like growth factor 2 antisense gene protein, partial [Lutra lutra]|uniref:putative insulin-like growth factor 2 antisense gene protein n=1 Tax=Lutra lutra TaxID=9657 RepID=UPI001FD4FC19